MSLKTLFYGIGFGAGLMYLYDPDRGNRRRSMMRDQWVGFLNDTDDLFAKGSRDLSNRARGITAEMRAMLSGEQVTDDVLSERVKSKIGRSISHPRAIQVTVQDGRVALHGPILAEEAPGLLARVGTVRGVTGIENQLEVHEDPGGVAALQGEPARTHGRAQTQGAWTPGFRLLAAAGGAMLALSGMRRGGIMGTARTWFGLALFARGMTNHDLRQMAGLSDEGDAVMVRKGMVVAAPVEEVFRFWRNYDNFPQFMSNVREVRDLGDGRSHWVVDGPAGTPVEWDARITNMVPNQVIAWESVPGSAVRQAGMVRFAPADHDTTHINVQMSYTPPAGVIGHAVASFFGVNPKQSMDEDLLRFKSLIERGETTAHDKHVTRDQVYQNRGQGKTERAQDEQHRAENRAGASRAATGTGAPQGDRGMPGGGAGRTDQVGETGVFPASDLEEAPDDARTQGMASWGQGERGAAGYEDSGSSELTGLGEETDFGSVIPGPTEPEE